MPIVGAYNSKHLMRRRRYETSIRCIIDYDEGTGAFREADCKTCIPQKVKLERIRESQPNSILLVLKVSDGGYVQRRAHFSD